MGFPFCSASGSTALSIGGRSCDVALRRWASVAALFDLADLLLGSIKHPTTFRRLLNVLRRLAEGGSLSVVSARPPSLLLPLWWGLAFASHDGLVDQPEGFSHGVGS